MYKKGWLTPLAVVLLFAGILIRYEHAHMDNILAISTTKSQLPWDKNIADIQKVSFAFQDQKITAMRTDTVWNLVSPISTRADATYIYSIISAFTSPSITGTLPMSESSLADYNIHAQSPTIILEDYEGNTFTFVCGKASDSHHYYAYSPNTNLLYTVPNHMFDLLSSSVSSWYDKDYIRFNLENTLSIEAITPYETHSIHFNHSVSPIHYYSDTLSDNVVDVILNFFKTSRIHQFITSEATPSLLNTYGFNEDVITFKVTNRTGEVLTFELNLKSPTDDGYYVYIPSDSTLITIPLFNIEFNNI